MRKNKTLESLGIDHNEYMELLYFCKQYLKKKEKLKSITCLKGMCYNGMPFSGICGSPTENTAIEVEELKRDIELIEQAAIETDSGIYQGIIKNVTEGVSFEYLDIPCGKNYFFNARQRFFSILYQNKKRGGNKVHKTCYNGYK